MLSNKQNGKYTISFTVIIFKIYQKNNTLKCSRIRFESFKGLRISTVEENLGKPAQKHTTGENVN